MNDIRYSVVIPAYNAAAFIGNAIESVLAQTCKPLEVIVVDDGSSDNTPAIVESYGDPVRLIRQTNSGPGAARNHGVRLATGDFIGLLDADDTWLPDKIERQAELIESERVALVHCMTTDEKQFATSALVSFDSLWKRNCIATSSVLVRRSVFNELGGFSLERSLIGTEDYNLWLRMAHAGHQMVTCNQALVDYMPQPASLSRQVAKFAAAEIANVASLHELLNLPDDLVRRKEIEIYEIYGQELLYCRHIDAARKMLALPLKQRATVRRLFWWGLTYLPVPILDLRRKFGQTARITQ